ncbi:DNA polymerase [Synechococcus phage ACG-2014d]|uniref:DNA-directed DNA polymerase n=1 Tax=Synechococcus phage ACG-2014d TaxID=1493509 RepID=A0A0E3FE21_9CAUD|nr:DNA polymerase [Synechococcus phage ACG-2014d]YP_010355314.1 DNA polymerase [Synechococcus phage ACG-2014d]AIX14756.1 DNA polymerase [Synechococcus phage ACG-2014d]AIX14975.1 DNA polymerase [Synechococcus phage ACG-2014d]AIX15402.1 DNA polymerase [Synechococcus phage ACG-2014d]AIX15621.1 DNA polymerase [Synechococcus phage ACG-2014d]AIX16050.1 DNA polymerase [Synechococcus phage ACG-2014d]
MSFYTNVQLIGNNILYRGIEGGERIQSRTEFSPTLFITSNKEEKYKTLTGRSVKPLKFENAREARQFAAKYEDVEGVEVHGYDRFLYQFISENFPGEIDYRTDQMNILAIDIEVECENGFPDAEAAAERMLCITVRDMNSKKFTVWGIREFECEHEHYIFNTEHEMLTHFINWWVQNTPDIVTGWNCNLYDIPYICRRVSRILGEKWMKSLSPWNKVDEEELFIQGRRNIQFDICGVSILDYMDLYKKFTYTNQESYRLDHIAFVELGQRKLDHSEYDNFKDFYTRDWQKFIDYNIMDVELVDRLEDKMRLLELALTMAYDAKVNFEDVYSQVRMWDTLIYNYLKPKNLVVPSKKRANKDEKYEGAYVKEPIPGLYNWVVSFDLNSLYPHLIMQYNISPETLVETKHPYATVDKLLKKEIDLSGDYAVCANGAQYRKDIHGFLPQMMQKIYDERKLYKKHMLAAKQALEDATTPEETLALQKSVSRFNNIQMARKIQLNSAYGAIGNQYFRYFNLANAEAITLSGQVSIRWIENDMNDYLNRILKTDGEDYVIASDTDSIYLNLGPLVDQVYKGREKTDESVVTFLDKVCTLELEPFIDRSYQSLATYANAYDQKMQMKRETIANKGIWTAKKRYILNAWDIEGVRFREPKLKIMGIEAVKSSTPAPCRQMIKDGLKVIMQQDEEAMQKFIAKFREEFKSLPPDQIAFPRGCNNLGKWSNPVTIFSSGTPIHVRGSLLYNHYIKSNKLTYKYPLVRDGDKVKYIYLKTPNKINQNVISFMGQFPKELGLDKSIDYDLQFEKSFLDPFKVILNTLGWQPEKISTLEFLFS